MDSPVPDLDPLRRLYERYLVLQDCCRLEGSEVPKAATVERLSEAYKDVSTNLTNWFARRGSLEALLEELRLTLIRNNVAEQEDWENTTGDMLVALFDEGLLAARLEKAKWYLSLTSLANAVNRRPDILKHLPKSILQSLPNLMWGAVLSDLPDEIEWMTEEQKQQVPAIIWFLLWKKTEDDRYLKQLHGGSKLPKLLRENYTIDAH
jgi:hypothetical protein